MCCWLSLVNATNFAIVSADGLASGSLASGSLGVRPISEAPLFGGPVAKGKVVYGESLKDSGIYAGAAALAYPMHKVTTM